MRGRLDNAAVERRLMHVEGQRESHAAARHAEPTVWVVTEVDTGEGTCTVQPRADDGSALGPELSDVLYDTQPAEGDPGILTRTATGALFFFRRYGAGPDWLPIAGVVTTDVVGKTIYARDLFYARAEPQVVSHVAYIQFDRAYVIDKLDRAFALNWREDSTVSSQMGGWGSPRAFLLRIALNSASPWLGTTGFYVRMQTISEEFDAQTIDYSTLLNLPIGIHYRTSFNLKVRLDQTYLPADAALAFFFDTLYADSTYPEGDKNPVYGLRVSVSAGSGSNNNPTVTLDAVDWQHIYYGVFQGSSGGAHH